MDAIRDKQEKIARIHFEQDSRLNETKQIYNRKIFKSNEIIFSKFIFIQRIDGEDYKAQSMRDLDELTRQVILFSLKENLFKFCNQFMLKAFYILILNY